MESLLGGIKSSPCVGELLQLALDQRQSPGGPEGEPLRGSGLEVVALKVNFLSGRSRSLLEDSMEGVMGSTQGSPCGGQLLQLSLHQGKGPGGPEGDPLRGGGLQVAAMGIDGLSSRLCRLLEDPVEGVLGSLQRAS